MADNQELKASAHDSSKVTQVGKIDANTVNFYLTTDEQKGALAAITSRSNPQGSDTISIGIPPKIVTHWQGRIEELATLQDWLQDDEIPLMGIGGIGAIGKSSLASKFLQEVEALPKFWADVYTGTSFSIIAREVIEALRFPPPEDEVNLVNKLVYYLRSRACLLIIDNVETVLTETGEWGNKMYEDFFRTWGEHGGKSTVLVTSRERPKLRSFSHWIDLKGLKRPEGAQLLAELGITGELEDFSEGVQGHPLLLRLVAELLLDEFESDPSLEKLPALGLENLQHLLTAPQVMGQHHKQDVGMVMVLDASFERLTDLQQRLFLGVSVYQREFNGEGASFILKDTSETALSPETLDAELHKLRRKYLVEETLDGNTRYFNLQPIILEYARYKAGDLTAQHQQAVAYYLSIAIPKPWHSLKQVKPYQEIFYHWYQLGEYDAAFDSLRHINEFLTLQGYPAIRVEHYSQLVRVYDSLGDQSNWKYTASLTDLGNAYHSLGEYQQAISLYQQSLEIYREIGDRNGEATSYMGLGNAYNSQGEYQQAISLYQQSLAIYLEIGDRNGEASSYMGLGNAYNSQGEYQQAISLHQQSLAIKREIGDRNGEASSYMGLGNAYNSQGEYQQAISLHQQSLAIKREIGDRNGEATSYNNLGNAYNSQGEYQQAISYLQQSLEIYREIGDRNGEASSYNNLGDAYRLLGEYQQAISLHQQSLAIKREIGDRNGEASSYMGLGNAYNSQGEYQQAISLHQQSLAIKREIGDRNGEATSYNNLGNAYNSQGEYQQAISYLQQSLEIYREIGDRNGEASSYNNLGDAYRLLGEYQQAISLHEQSLAICREIGDRKGEANSYMGLGNAYDSLGEYQQAISLYQQSLEISLEIGDRNGEANSYNNLGSAYYSQGEYQQAISFHQQSLAISREIGDHKGKPIPIIIWGVLTIHRESINRQSLIFSSL
jgi:tetratricopeptide (TPR) repeat protein